MKVKENLLASKVTALVTVLALGNARLRALLRHMALLLTIMASWHARLWAIAGLVIWAVAVVACERASATTAVRARTVFRPMTHLCWLVMPSRVSREETLALMAFVALHASETILQKR